MKKLTSKTMFYLSILVLMLCSFPAGAIAMESDDAPTTVTIDYLQDLYAAVEFDHHMHAENYACNTCHHHTTGAGAQNERCAKCHADSGLADDVSCSGCHQRKEVTPTALAKQPEKTVYHIDKPAIKGALHLQCLGCHQAEGGPTGCQDCHAFTAEGRKRFAVHNETED